jgi:hypothetical protein
MATATNEVSPTNELTARERTQLESEIRALRAQVIALGGDPDDNPNLHFSKQITAHNSDEDSELGDLGLLPPLDVAEGEGLLVNMPQSAPTAYSAPTDGRGSATFAELCDRDVDGLLSDVVPVSTPDECACPYCGGRPSSAMMGNRSTIPRLQNPLGMW